MYKTSNTELFKQNKYLDVSGPCRMKLIKVSERIWSVNECVYAHELHHLCYFHTNIFRILEYSQNFPFLTLYFVSWLLTHKNNKNEKRIYMYLLWNRLLNTNTLQPQVQVWSFLNLNILNLTKQNNVTVVIY